MPTPPGWQPPLADEHNPQRPAAVAPLAPPLEAPPAPPGGPPPRQALGGKPVAPLPTPRAPKPVPGQPLKGARRSLLRELLPIAVLAIVVYVAFSFAVQVVRVDGTSMSHTLEDGQLLLLDKVSYRFHAPERGDIVVVSVSGEDKPFIKRVVGVPGDRIAIDPGGSAGQPRILITPQGSSRQEKLVESYLPEPMLSANGCCQPDGRQNDGRDVTPITIPPDHFFVLGDNRNNSKDTRYIGLIDRDQFLGRAWFRFWPLGNFGGFGAGPTQVPAVFPLPLILLRRRRRQIDDELVHCAGRA